MAFRWPSGAMVELETFLGDWQEHKGVDSMAMSSEDSFGNDVSVDWAKSGARGGQWGGLGSEGLRSESRGYPWC